MTNLAVMSCNPNGFLAQLSLQSKATKIWYLDLSFMGYMSSLRGLSDLFSESDVKIFRISIARRSWMDIEPENDPQMAVTFFESLPSSLPQQIVKLAINWEFTEPVKLPDMKELKDAIRAQHPSLKTLWIHCGHCALVWGEMPDGTESIAYGGPDFAAKIRDGFEMFFYGLWRSPVSEDEQSVKNAAAESEKSGNAGPSA
ncbi:hypothetical protein B0H19DRAFT_1250098 [Mycena capillaripes]|nr:hypothetical protein B0H19DRAFT_1250098 [Mycena capillaripes]